MQNLSIATPTHSVTYYKSPNDVTNVHLYICYLHRELTRSYLHMDSTTALMQWHMLLMFLFSASLADVCGSHISHMITLRIWDVVNMKVVNDSQLAGTVYVALLHIHLIHYVRTYIRSSTLKLIRFSLMLKATHSAQRSIQDCSICTIIG